MSMHPHVAELFERRKLVLIAGPCVIESLEVCSQVAEAAKRIAARHDIGYIFKASFDKANRTSLSSFRGPGLEEGLRILAEVKRVHRVPVLTDIHHPEQAEPAARVADVLQIPAFLCRQTDLLVAAANTGLPANIKKGQFLAPEDMRHAVAKFRESGGQEVAVTERGTTFGYHNLVVDMRSLVWLREATGAAVIFDATHSVQRPSGGEGVTTGDRDLAPALAAAAAAVGIDALFCEVHPEPQKALSDAANSIAPDALQNLLERVIAIDAIRR